MDTATKALLVLKALSVEGADWIKVYQYCCVALNQNPRPGWKEELEKEYKKLDSVRFS